MIDYEAVLGVARAACAEVGHPPGNLMLNDDVIEVCAGDLVAYRAALLALQGAYGSAKLVPCPDCIMIPYQPPCVTIADALTGTTCGAR